MYIGELYSNAELYGSIELAKYDLFPLPEQSAVGVIFRDGVTIVGQMEMTIAHVANPIEISNRSVDKYTKYLDAELSTKQIQISGTITYNNSSVFNQIRLDALAGDQASYTVVYNSNNSVDERFEGVFVPSGLSDSINFSGKITTSITFLSSGAVQHTAAQ